MRAKLVTGGSIIVRQRGTPLKPGLNVGRGKDDTLFAKIGGRVQFMSIAAITDASSRSIPSLHKHLSGTSKSPADGGAFLRGFVMSLLSEGHAFSHAIKGCVKIGFSR